MDALSIKPCLDFARTISSAALKVQKRETSPRLFTAVVLLALADAKKSFLPGWS